MARRAPNYARNVGFALKHPSMLRRIRQAPSSVKFIDIAPAEIAPFAPSAPVIIEAGAYDGSDTRRFAEQWPDATIYSFEPIPELFERLSDAVADLPNVHPQPFGLADYDGTATMRLSHWDEDPQRVGASSSMLAPMEHERLCPSVHFGAEQDVPVLTLDSWARRTGVDRVDLAWLDMQGMELRALRAAPELRSTLSVICMEVARRELYAGNPKRGEVVRWMRGEGYKVVIDRAIIPFGNMLFARDPGTRG